LYLYAVSMGRGGTTMTSNKEKARANELTTLQAIGLVGWLSASQVAHWVWGRENPHSARVSADRVLKRLQDDALIMRRASGTGVFVYVLTKRGAAVANGSLTVPLFRAGYDLSQLDVARQAPAVEYLAEQRHAGNTVLGLAAVRKGMEVGLLKSKALKGADGVVVDHETGQQRAVLVVRNVHPELVKKAKRLKKVYGSLELVGDVGLLRSFQREMKAR
jgi:hypothetical protein